MEAKTSLSSGHARSATGAAYPAWEYGPGARLTLSLCTLKMSSAGETILAVNKFLQRDAGRLRDLEANRSAQYEQHKKCVCIQTEI